MAPPSRFSSPPFHTGASDAIRLNNAATLLIERGHYDNAITSLERALRLLELHIMNENNMNRTRIYCACNECTLDGCIAFSEKQNLNRAPSQTCIDVHTDSSINCAHIGATNSSNRRRRTTYHDGDIEENSNRYNNDNESDYIYKHAILIPNDHEMGSTRFFVILFNIALANHLKALSSTTNTTTNNKTENENETERDNGSIRRALLLYELMFEHWSRLQAASRHISTFDGHEGTSSSTSFRFVMIMYNNMSQMYRLVNDTIRQRQCLQNLLSVVMIAIESKHRNADSSFASQGAPAVQNSSNSHSNGSGDNENDAFQESLEGFLANTTTLIMSGKICARAA